MLSKNQDNYLKKNKKRKHQNIKLVEMVSILTKKEKIKLSKKTIENIQDCGNWMQFLSDKQFEKRKLYQGTFCKNRFCPICSKKKSVNDTLAIKIMTEYIRKELKRQFLFVTFTAPNVTGEYLKHEVTKYNKAFNHFIKLKKYKNIIQGYIRKLEVTYNNDKTNKSYNTYHPHFHVLISVNSSYFKGGNYIKRNEWLKDWQEVMNDNTITQVDVKRVKMGSSEEIDKSILEITKYVAKDSNYLETEEVFEYFYKGLKGKRIYAFGGDYKLARDKFKKGELDYLIPEDKTEWYYLLTNTWMLDKYQEEKQKISELPLSEQVKILKLDIERDIE